MLVASCFHALLGLSIVLVSLCLHPCFSAGKVLVGETHPGWQQVGTLYFTYIALILFKDSLC